MDEYRRFIQAISTPNANLSALFKIPCSVHKISPHPAFYGPAVLVFSEPFFNNLTSIPEVDEPVRKVIDNAPELDRDCQKDSYFNMIPDRYQKIIYTNPHKETIAILDTTGTLHFTDFFHPFNNSDRAPWFWDVFNDAFPELAAETPINGSELIDQLKQLCPVRIVDAEVRVAFDKDTFMVETQKLVSRLESRYKTQIAALTSAHEAQIKELNELVRAEAARAFIAGVNLSNMKKWKVEDSFLVYTERIEVKQIKSGGKVYEYNPEHFQEIYIDLLECGESEVSYDPDDLNFNLFANEIKVRAEPFVYSAYAGDHRHPNIELTESLPGYSICLGDLEGEPIQVVLDELPATLETANLDSAFESPIVDVLREVAHVLDSDNEVWEVY
ncbi:MAG: hypothetical protein ACXQTA_01355 [Candidatus Syntropharchaeales archaeon]